MLLDDCRWWRMWMWGKRREDGVRHRSCRRHTHRHVTSTPPIAVDIGGNVKENWQNWRLERQLPVRVRQACVPLSTRFKQLLTKRVISDTAQVDGGSPPFVTPTNQIHQPDTMPATMRMKKILAGNRAKVGLLVASEGLLSSCPPLQSSL